MRNNPMFWAVAALLGSMLVSNAFFIVDQRRIVEAEIAEFERQPEDVRARVLTFLGRLPGQYVFDGGRLVVADPAGAERAQLIGCLAGMTAAPAAHVNAELARQRRKPAFERTYYARRDP